LHRPLLVAEKIYPMPTYYDELEVSAKASPETVRAPYRSLIQRFHPNRNLGSPEFALRTQRVNDAYAVLSNSEKRAPYDAKLFAEDVLNRAEAEEELRRKQALATARERELQKMRAKRPEPMRASQPPPGDTSRQSRRRSAAVSYPDSASFCRGAFCSG
jgi:curved DNA-binding protein CbpA